MPEVRKSATAGNRLIVVGFVLVGIAILTVTGQFIGWMFSPSWPSLSISKAIGALGSMLSHPLSGGAGLLSQFGMALSRVVEMPLGLAMLILGALAGLVGVSLRAHWAR